ncbi:MAG: DNA methyltransferase, partial [Pseudomonadota bacterium]
WVGEHNTTWDTLMERPTGTRRGGHFFFGAFVMIIEQKKEETMMKNTKKKTEKNIQDRLVTALKAYQNNPKTHSDAQINQIIKSIETFGWTYPILVDEDLMVLAGHGRLEAAKRMVLKKVPTLKVVGLTQAQKKAYVIADNKISENGGWDSDLLQIEFESLSGMDLNFDLELTGFSAPQIDIALGRASNDNSGDQEDLDPGVAVMDHAPVTKPGDLWRLGDHLLYCGDVGLPESYEALGVRDPIAMVIADPPYNVPARQLSPGLRDRAQFTMGSGEMSSEDYIGFLTWTLSKAKAETRDGGLFYVFMDWRHIAELTAAADHCALTQLNLCVWNKSNAGLGSFYRSKHELIFVLKTGDAPHINNIELGVHGRNRSNVWDYAGANGFSRDGRDGLKGHPTPKPVALLADAILDATHQGNVVLDLFSGSGSAILAAEQTGRIARSIEIDPLYVDYAIARFQQKTGIHAVHAKTGQRYEALRADRQNNKKNQKGAA